MPGNSTIAMVAPGHSGGLGSAGYNKISTDDSSLTGVVTLISLTDDTFSKSKNRNQKSTYTYICWGFTLWLTQLRYEC